VAVYFAALETIFRGRAYLEWYAQHKIPITDDQLRQLHHDELEHFREPTVYLLRELVLKIPSLQTSDTKEIESRMTYLKEKVAPLIKNERIFERMALSTADWPPNRDQRGEARQVVENYRGEQFAQTLAGLEIGRCVGPFHVGDEVFLLWIRDRSPTSYRPFEDVREQVRSLYILRHWDELLSMSEKDISARHSFEYLFAFGKGG